uniref:Uncharacterized protein n=1 Tax=Electrophorus electricus TaxID=8005 RepID=A0AAY5ENL6_ELEEL
CCCFSGAPNTGALSRAHAKDNVPSLGGGFVDARSRWTVAVDVGGSWCGGVGVGGHKLFQHLPTPIVASQSKPRARIHH